jgi:hypothetical protein
MEYMASSSAPLWFKQAEVSLKKALNDLVTRDWNSAALWSQQAPPRAGVDLRIYDVEEWNSNENPRIRELKREDVKLE